MWTLLMPGLLDSLGAPASGKAPPEAHLDCARWPAAPGGLLPVSTQLPPHTQTCPLHQVQQEPHTHTVLDPGRALQPPFHGHCMQNLFLMSWCAHILRHPIPRLTFPASDKIASSASAQQPPRLCLARLLKCGQQLLLKTMPSHEEVRNCEDYISG